MRLLTYFRRWSSADLTIVAIVMVLAIGVLDNATGNDISFQIFYLVPIALVAWHGERWQGTLLSVASAAAWLVADLALQPAAMVASDVARHPAANLVPYVNTAMRLALFLIIARTLNSLRAAQDKQAELAEFVIHDLRSPLTNVMAGLQLLDDPDGQSVSAEQQEMREMAVISAQRMMRLIDALLDISRMEGDRMPVHLSDVDPGKLAATAVDQVSLWARNAHIAIEVECDPKSGAAHVDRALAERVLVNILGNALRHSPPNTTIRLRVAPRGKDAIAFSVADEGPGIPEEWLPHIFDKFTQVAARKSGAVHGSGLGLTFCRCATEAQDGRISIESEVGKGTTVTIAVPGAPALRSGERREPETAGAARP